MFTKEQEEALEALLAHFIDEYWWADAHYIDQDGLHVVEADVCDDPWEQNYRDLWDRNAGDYTDNGM